ncbi:MAG: LPS export ABC transporter periplasmic protein LptC [Robiginitomaculum sp.]
MSTINTLHEANHALDLWEPRRVLTLDAARKHSARVGFVRKILLGLCALILAVLIYFFLKTSKHSPAPTPQAYAVKMVNPTYKGRMSDGEPYRLSADFATRNTQTPEIVELERPILHFVNQSGALELGTTPSESTILAYYGLFNNAKQIIELEKNVHITMADGNVCLTSHTRLFLQAKRAEGDKAIDCMGAFGQASGNAYEINQQYTEFVFKNGMNAQLISKSPPQTNTNLRGSNSASNAPSVLSFGGDAPIDILAQKAVYKGSIILLSGSAHITQGEAEIFADSIDVFRTELPPALEQGKYGDINKLVAVGGFKYVGKQNTITGDKGVYEQDKNIITVTGNVVFSQNNNDFVGSDELIYDLTTKSMRFAGKCLGEKCKDSDRVAVVTGN